MPRSSGSSMNSRPMLSPSTSSSESMSSTSPASPWPSRTVATIAPSMSQAVSGGQGSISMPSISPSATR